MTSRRSRARRAAGRVVGAFDGGMAVKEEKIEVEGEIVESLPSTMFRVQSTAATRPRDHLREDAQELHPHPARRRVKVELSPTTSRGRITYRYRMKVRASVKPMCERCRVIKRHGTTMVICTNPRHKQRQG